MNRPVLKAATTNEPFAVRNGAEHPRDERAVVQHRLLVAMNRFEREYCPILLPAEITAAVKTVWFDSDLSSAKWRDVLEEFCPTILLSSWTTPTIPEDYLTSPACCLEYVCHIFGSTRSIVPRLFLERGGLVTNWGDVISPQVAELALLLALGALRNMRRWDSFIREQNHHPRVPIPTLATRTLFDQKVGIHGFGRIARELVKLLKPFRVQLSAYSDGVPEEFMRAHDVQPCHSLKELFAGNNVIFGCEALRPGTENIVSGRVLAALPDDAVFVNVGRGRTVDEAALHREVASGRIRAALDVFVDEPLTSESPFFALPGALLSPHIGGPTNDRFSACVAMALQNLVRYVAGDRPEFVVNLSDYDRAT